MFFVKGQWAAPAGSLVAQHSIASPGIAGARIVFPLGLGGLGTTSGVVQGETNAGGVATTTSLRWNTSTDPDLTSSGAAWRVMLYDPIGYGIPNSNVWILPTVAASFWAVQRNAVGTDNYPGMEIRFSMDNGASTLPVSIPVTLTVTVT